MKSSKTQISKIVKLAGFLDRLLGPLMKVSLPFMKNVIKPLKTFLIYVMKNFFKITVFKTLINC